MAHNLLFKYLSTLRRYYIYYINNIYNIFISSTSMLYYNLSYNITKYNNIIIVSTDKVVLYLRLANYYIIILPAIFLFF